MIVYAVFDEYGGRFPCTERGTVEEAEAIRREMVAHCEQKYNEVQASEFGLCVGMYDNAVIHTQPHEGVTYVRGWRAEQ